MSAINPLEWSPPQPAAVHREKAGQPVPWIIPGHINVGGFGWLLGRRGSYKTGFALHLAIATVLGRPPFGEDWHGVETSGLVTYMDGHENNDLLYPRIEHILNGLSATAEEREKLWATLHTYHGTDINIFTGRNFDRLVDWAKDIRPVLMIFDTFQRFYAGGGYTDADTAEAIVRDAQLRYESGTATLWIHHPPKSREASDPFRGGSGFLDAADFAFELERPRQGGMIKVGCIKFRPGPEPEPFQLSVVEEVPEDSARQNGILAIRYRPAGRARQDELWDRIRDYVRQHSGTSKRKIIKGVEGRNEDIMAEIDRRVGRGLKLVEDSRKHSYFLTEEEAQ